MPRGRPKGSKNKPRDTVVNISTARPRAPRGVDGQAADANSGEATKFANMKVRADLIRKACRDISDLDAKRKSIGEEIRSIKQSRIKGDLKMKIADFNASLRLYRLEGDDRKTFFDTLRETFAALLPGEQANFFAGLDPNEQTETATQPPRQRREHTEGVSSSAIAAAQTHLYGGGENDAGDDDMVDVDAGDGNDDEVGDNNDFDLNDPDGDFLNDPPRPAA